MVDLDKILGNLSPVKVFVIGVLITSMFWYLDIFLFGKELITVEQVQIPIIISLCLGFIWTSIASACGQTYFNLTFVNKKKIPDDVLAITNILDKKVSHLSIYNLFYSPFSLAGITFMDIEFYRLFSKPRPTFIEFTLDAFFIIIGILAFITVIFNIKARLWKKELLKIQLEKALVAKRGVEPLTSGL